MKKALGWLATPFTAHRLSSRCGSNDRTTNPLIGVLGQRTMTTERYAVTEEVLRRFDKPGPRYTSYPTAAEFHEGIGEQAYRERLADADAQGADARRRRL